MTCISRDRIKAKALEIGFHKVGIAAIAAAPMAAEQATQTDLKQWLAKGFHADMAWMGNPKRLDVRQLMPTARSIICVALNYYTPHSHPKSKLYGKISRYGWGRDYHRNTMLTQGQSKISFGHSRLGWAGSLKTVM